MRPPVTTSVRTATSSEASARSSTAPSAQQNAVAGLHVAGEIGVAGGCDFAVADHRLGGDGEGCAGLQDAVLVLEPSEPDLRALADRAGYPGARAQPRGCRADRLNPRGVLLLRSVRRIQAENIDAVGDQLREHAGGVGGWAESGYDLGVGHVLLVCPMIRLSRRHVCGADRWRIVCKQSGGGRRARHHPWSCSLRCRRSAGTAERVLGLAAGPGRQYVLWHDPGSVETLDFRYGIGGEALAPKAPFTFVEEDPERHHAESPACKRREPAGTG